MTIRIGTASWADKSLIDTGRFYPPDVTTAESRLGYYATQFPLVEVDSSYYAVPSVDTAHLWTERTPDGFVMNVKAFRLFTGHQTSPAVLPSDLRDALPSDLKLKSVIYYRDVPGELVNELWARFREALQPLREAGRLGLVHFQFPPWLLRNRAGHAHVAHCVERMAGHTLSVEFRSDKWFEGPHAAETIAFQRELGVVHTIVDEPTGLSNIPSIWEATRDDCALVRMHGRNAAAWNDRSGHSGGRFNYDYDDAELEGLAHQIQLLDRPGLDVHVVMNNNKEDQAQRNGRTLFKTMKDLKANVVVPTAR
ncbi:DUF72 domain-containing protein [Pelomonas sp. Root1444]|uniref:DUF72 domain-containing protein n=1 Tax=Pelomonas sp. Root1444 TaxID=1736464 RepID=UPI0007024005|nr:DUF72 domain-containing protein [Pelomonas sp. Root1444]KQY88284.1 hypothetical protein ASD35_11885 [Pelomonas sp. Root1444]